MIFLTRSSPPARWLFALGILAATLAGSARHIPAAALPVYTLNDCQQLAARQNPDVLIASKRVEDARALVTQARAGIFPTLSSTGYYQRREQSISSSGGINNGIRPDDYTADIRLTQSLYSSGAVRNRLAAARIAEHVARLEYQTALDLANLQVREAFNATVAAEQSIAVRQQALDLLGTQLKDQQDRLSAGTVGQINVNRAQVSLANEQPALLQAQSNVRTAYAALAQVLGVAYPEDPASRPSPAHPPVEEGHDAPFRVRGTLEISPFVLTREECLARAYAKRPEIEARTLALDVLKHQLVVEKAGTRPQLFAFAAYDVYSQPDLASTSENFSGYTVGLSATWTLFDGFLTLGRVRGVRAQIAEAQVQLESTKLEVKTDVVVAYEQLKTAEATLRPQSQNISLANETLDLTNRNFAAGLNSQLDVLQSRVDLTRSRTVELGGRLAYNNALARLERAMGVGRPSPDDPKTVVAQPTLTPSPTPRPRKARAASQHP